MDKVEGDSLINSSSSGGGGSFNDQMLDLEEQLKKAQETMAQLQALKEKLEVERVAKLEQAKKEKETVDLKKLQEENFKLKDELNNYQEEITSLKDVIASLKVDLRQSAEQFQSKVENSLKILENAEADVNLKAKNISLATDKKDNGKKKTQKNTEKDENSATKLPDEEKEKPVETEKEAEVKAAGNDSPAEAVAEETKSAKSAETATEATEETENLEAQPAEVAEATTVVKTEETVASVVEPTTESKEATETVSNTGKAVAEAEPKDAEPAAKAVSEEPKRETEETTQPVNNDKTENADQANTEASENNTSETDSATPEEEPDTENISIEDEELSEYEKIKKELEELVKGNIINSTDSSTSAVPAASPQPEATPTNESVDASIAEKAEDQGKTESDNGNDATEKPKVNKFLSFFNKKKTAKPKDNAAQAKADDDKDLGKHIDNNKKSENGKLLVKAAVFVLIIAGGFLGYRINNADKLRSTYIAQAKTVYEKSSQNGSSSTPSEFQSNPPEVRYKEAYADVPVESTIWETYNDAFMGLKVSYPKNASYRLKSSDQNSMWFLRKEGYLMKVDKIATDLPLDKYLADFKTNISYKTEITTFGKLPAVLLTQNEKLAIQGNIYLVKTNNNTLYQIWYKTYEKDENPGDEARVKKMLESIEFVTQDAKDKK